MAAEIYTTGREDLAKIIAQETSGVVDAVPELDDYDMADRFLNYINNPSSYLP